jgi:hypothetical protein
MKKILIGTLVLASGMFASVLMAQSGVSLNFRAGRSVAAADGTIAVQNLTITTSDMVITADDATIEGTTIKPGANARISGLKTAAR